jgi:hypothetical protein
MKFGKFQISSYLCQMSRYSIRTENTESIKKLTKKFGREVPVSNSFIRGVFTVKNFRKYQYRDEVDIDFQGEIYVTWRGKKDWYDASLMDKTQRGLKPSKIKVNRFIRKNIIVSVQTYLNYFCVDVRHYSDILKIKWL